MKSTTTAQTLVCLFATLQFVASSVKFVKRNEFAHRYPEIVCRDNIRAPPHGHLRPSRPPIDGYHSQWTTLTLTCDAGYVSKFPSILCLIGWSRTDLECLRDPCLSNPCGDNGQCRVDRAAFRCTCNGGWIGRLCDQRDPCLDNPCGDNGQCRVDGAAFACTCNSGRKGGACQEREGCPPIDPLDNGQIYYDKKSIDGKYPYDIQAEFVCFEGFDPQGHSSTKCKAPGVWTNPTPTCSKGGGCFPSSAKVKLESGKIVPMSELQIGDQVQIVSSDTRVMYSEVKTFLKAQQDVINNYKSITCGNKTIVLSEDHLIYAKQTDNDRFTLICADQVSIGDEVLVEQNHRFVPAKVTKVSSHLLQGAYVPLTVEGNIVVDGVLASCYTSVHHDLVHIGMGPIRWFPNIVESILGQDNGYAAYASIAHTLGKWMFLDGQLGGQ